ncbi:CorA family divalent cation transporter [Lysobacter sp. F6437]|uniref:CorA family divalent cation transporter n=1 Tax=Lysobacter sp. F6437 TaxID=3459296 RepID=UPI00403E1516
MPNPEQEATGHYAILFDADGDDRRLELDDLAGLQLADSQLLWVDLRAPGADMLDKIWQAFELPERSRKAIEKDATRPALGKNGEVFWVRVAALAGNPPDDDAVTRKDMRVRPKGLVLAIIAGKRFVLTIHDEPVEYLDEQRNREDVDSHVGAMSAESFTAALLDWQLSTYFDAVADFELDIERLEVGILSDRRLDCLPQLRQLRKGASRLRRMLAPHRVVFDGMSRPDFRPTEGEDADRHFEKLDIHFERAMDVVENARELVVGSFELFSSQTALQTNKSMAVLTFATVVLGLLAVLAGVLGMNFDAAFFDTRTTGFMVAAGAMSLLGIIALVIGRLKHWF